jgi:hypothetical protein
MSDLNGLPMTLEEARQVVRRPDLHEDAAVLAACAVLERRGDFIDHDRGRMLRPLLHLGFKIHSRSFICICAALASRSLSTASIASSLSIVPGWCVRSGVKLPGGGGAPPGGAGMTRNPLRENACHA